MGNQQRSNSKYLNIMKKINIETIREIAALDGNLLVSDVYINNTLPLIFKGKCGHTFQKSWKEYKRYENKCTLCNIALRKSSIKPASFKSLTEIVNKFNELSKGDYELFNLDTYVNFKTKLNFKHITCDTKFQMSWNDFQQGHRCPRCKGIGRRLSKKSLSHKIESNKNLKFVDSRFIYDIGHIVTTLHLKCNRFSTSRLDAYMAGFECSFCKLSKGERFISELLERLEIEFDKEVRFTKCKNKQTLPFDFRIQYGKRKILIEYDGQQHFEPCFGREDTFKKTVKNDSIKNTFVENSKTLPLIRIKYTADFNKIEDYFNNFELNVQRLSKGEILYIT